MNKVLIEYLNTLSPSVIIVAIIIICLFCWVIFKNHKTISYFLNELYNRKKNKEDLLKTIHENQAEIKQIMENRIHDREQSFTIQRELTESIASLSKKIDNMQLNTNQRFEENERKNNKRIRAELKDKISQSYRYYHSIGKINDMELEALEDLIEEYESAEGKNSFVHSVVQKEMYTWEKVDNF